jgi:hypothetical protein
LIVYSTCCSVNRTIVSFNAFNGIPLSFRRYDFKFEIQLVKYKINLFIENCKNG